MNEYRELAREIAERSIRLGRNAELILKWVEFRELNPAEDV